MNQSFYAENLNKSWCTDFTYLFLVNDSVRYNCTIIDLYDRSVVASITDKWMTADLAIRTTEKALQAAGCPYDNAPMERYFNTLKAELIYQYRFDTDEELNHAISEFAYNWYNQVRPHSYDDYRTPFEKRNSVA